MRQEAGELMRGRECLFAADQVRSGEAREAWKDGPSGFDSQSVGERFHREEKVECLFN